MKDLVVISVGRYQTKVFMVNLWKENRVDPVRFVHHQCHTPGYGSAVRTQLFLQPVVADIKHSSINADAHKLWCTLLWIGPGSSCGRRDAFWGCKDPLTAAASVS